MATSVLAMLTQLFADVLGRPEFGVSDSFFTAGGDSLGAAEVLARIQEELDVTLTFQAFLEAPTPARLGLTLLGELARQHDGDLATEIAALSAEDAAVLVAELEKHGLPPH